ncbi:MAG: DNA internalization-related competence protein ComEC/Rec2 [Candidatus Sericytochromatia bacterium]|nr:DNA internalization-related competence protein ComEC/Rec2 [Candidatus Sericytochromatia bacterium]
MLRALALGLCFGALGAPVLPCSSVSVATLPLAVFLLPRVPPPLRTPVCGLAMVLPAAAWRQTRRASPSALDPCRAAPRRYFRLRGTVVSAPEGGPGRWRSVVRVEPWAGKPLRNLHWRGLVAVRFPPAAKRPRPGEVWNLAGRLSETLHAQNPGAFDSYDFWAQRGVFSTMQAQEGAYETLSSRWNDRTGWALDVLRLRLLDGLTPGLSPAYGALLGSLVLGAGAAPVPPEMASLFRDVGLAHLLAASGAQVAILGGLIVYLARKLGFGDRAAVAMALPTLLVYFGLTGGTPGMLRATCMGMIGLAGIALGRSGVPFAAFWGTLILIVTLDPGSVSDLGFQFSALATYALLRLSHHWRGRPWLGMAWLAPAVLSPVVTWLWVAPLQAHTFFSLPLMGIPANWLAGFLISLLTPWGLGLSVLGLLSPNAVRMANALTEYGVGALCLIAETAARFDGQLLAVPALPLWGIVACYLILAIPFWRGKAIAGAMLLLFTTFAPDDERKHLTVTVLSVGQGDAVVVQTPQGGTVLVDGGPSGVFGDKGRQTLIPFLRQAGVHRIDLMVATHPHIDHIGGLPSVVAAVPVAQAWEAGAAGSQTALNPLFGAWLNAGVPWKTGAQPLVWRSHGVTIEALPVFTGAQKINDASLVLRLTYGTFTMLLPGDLEQAGEDYLLRVAPQKLQADVLKVAHHGARTSTGDGWLRAVKPQLAVVSVGRNNVHGHPHEDTLKRLKRHQVAIARTDQAGAAQIRVTTDGWTWSTAVSNWKYWHSPGNGLGGRRAS